MLFSQADDKFIMLLQFFLRNVLFFSSLSWEICHFSQALDRNFLFLFLTFIHSFWSYYWYYGRSIIKTLFVISKFFLKNVESTMYFNALIDSKFRHWWIVSQEHCTKTVLNDLSMKHNDQNEKIHESETSKKFLKSLSKITHFWRAWQNIKK